MMPTKTRSSPNIPDHEVLRKIGGGAYGEVWLARGVTGAWRAVKVVWREDFEDERGFEREFEGILKFEPISRDHPALMNILHVGRSPDGVSFYYYVMELGDDVDGERDINPIEYEPRTLRADHHQAAGVMWDVDDCIDVGLRLAEALHHLHEHGLAHRDVKPSNVIFVNGRAKLADIGLVAARGQRTFVGTEGFVPPEGPGSAQADVYSLGKVLYEIATGKDRMNFPELPDEMPPMPGRKRWLELNRIICDVCEPRISKRKITTAAELTESLRRIQRGKRRRRSGVAVWITTFLLAGFAGWAGWHSLSGTEWFRERSAFKNQPVAEVGLLRIFSTPEGADVFDAGGVMVGTTPTPTLTARVGEEVRFTLRKNGYRPTELQGRLDPSAVNEPMIFYEQLQVFAPPQQGEVWVDHVGSRYLPVEGRHVSVGFVTAAAWNGIAREIKLPEGQGEVLAVSQDGRPVPVVLTSEAVSLAFCDALKAGGVKNGFLTEMHEVKPLREVGFQHPELSERARKEGWVPFRVTVRQIKYGSLHVITNPPGAEVYINGQAAGTSASPLLVPELKPGPVELLLVLEGYKPLVKTLALQEGQTLAESLTLEKNQGVVFGRAWENAIGMRFAPVGQNLMVSIWETRVADYELFVRESGRPGPRAPYFDQVADHPVVGVSREDAVAFCDWLTVRERKAERISGLHGYRLPTDLEWSRFADLQEEAGISPNWRDARKQRVFPWGMSWPDGERVGNFADISAARTPGVESNRTIAGYNDGFPYTAPVGSFPPNRYGIFDLSGNVQEWVSDEFSLPGNNMLGVLRGGAWNTYQIESLYSGSRNAGPPTYQDLSYGFRVVLARVPQETP